MFFVVDGSVGVIRSDGEPPSIDFAVETRFRRTRALPDPWEIDLDIVTDPVAARDHGAVPDAMRDAGYRAKDILPD